MRGLPLSRQNFPGDSACDLGIVTNGGSCHVCQICKGDGCKPKIPGRASRARRLDQLLKLSGSTILSDQKGRAVFVDLEAQTAYVMEE